MTVERFLARRYLLGKKRFTFINIISLLATLGIAFGVAALIVVMSVFNGFNSLVTDIMLSVDPHLVVERVSTEPTASPASEIARLLAGEEHVRGVSRFVQRKAMALAGGTTRFIQVRGYDPATVDLVSDIRAKVIMGTARPAAPTAVLVGIAVADQMRILEGDTVVLVSPTGMQNMLTQYVNPVIYACPVAGVFDSKNKVYDASTILLPLPAARSFFRVAADDANFAVRLDDIDHSGAVAEKLRKAAGPGWRVRTWYDLHKDLYSMMKVERWSAFILLGVIIAVAVFNILASLTMLVLEKRRDIGILRTMGLAADRIRRLFLMQGLWIGLIGVVAGAVLGLTLCWLQATFGLFTLDSAFIIPALPVEVRVSDLLIIAGATFVLCLLAALPPARRAMRVDIIDAVRWE